MANEQIESRAVRLKSGGTVTITVAHNIFALSSSDRDFVFGLIDKLAEYEGSSPAAHGDAEAAPAAESKPSVRANGTRDAILALFTDGENRRSRDIVAALVARGFKASTVSVRLSIMVHRGELVCVSRGVFRRAGTPAENETPAAPVESVAPVSTPPAAPVRSRPRFSCKKCQSPVYESDMTQHVRTEHNMALNARAARMWFGDQPVEEASTDARPFSDAPSARS